MKKIRLILIAGVCLFAHSVFSVEYETVYSCDFESSDLSEWNLINAEELINIGATNTSDMFYIGSLTSYSGKSLYVSQDNGNSILIDAGGNATLSTVAELNLTLPAGNYNISFLYKTGNTQNLNVVLFSEKLNMNSRLDNLTVTNADDWNMANFPFSLSESCNWILFSYRFSQDILGTGTIESVAIDNIIIKKEVTATDLTQISTEKAIQKEEYFGIDGASTTLSRRGFVIKKITYTDGTVKVEKVLQ